MTVQRDRTKFSTARARWRLISQKRPSTVEEVVPILLENRKADPSFLNGSISDLEPFLSAYGMKEGAALFSHHLHRENKIVLVGDYDCDGITSLAQVALFLRDIGYSPYEVVIPSRSEGYGFPLRALEMHPDAKLFVALDCGTSDAGVIERVRKNGADVIVVDHHEVPDRGAAPANVLINPKQPQCASPFKEFASAGLTLLFLARLRRVLPEAFPPPPLDGKYLTLAALGTVADVVPLLSANRILVQGGLKCLNTRNFGPMNALMEQAGLRDRPDLSAGDLAFYLGPRINVAGRMDEPLLAYRLLMSQSPRDAVHLARRLHELNALRQKTEESILRSITGDSKVLGSRGRTLVLGDPSWPHGLVGILASRLQREVHYGPVVLFAMDQEKGVARGSARSVPGINIYEALGKCSHLLLKWGGHEQAAGMTLELRHFDEFAHCFEEVMQSYPREHFIPEKKVDALISGGLITPSLLEALKQLEPHGMGNPTPTFGIRNAGIQGAVPFGRGGDHLRLKLNGGLKAIYWRGANLLDVDSLSRCGPQDLAFQVERDPFQGKPVLNLKDLGSLF